MDEEPASDGHATWRTAIDGLDNLTPEDLFPVFGAIQDVEGCVPRAAIVELAKRTGVPQARIWGALTAYPGFKVAED